MAGTISQSRTEHHSIGGRRPLWVFAPVVLRTGRKVSFANLVFDRLPARAERRPPRKTPTMILGSGLILLGMMAGLFAWPRQVVFAHPDLMVAAGFAAAVPVAMILFGLWRLVRREIVELDETDVSVRSRTLFGESRWREPLANYSGVDIVRYRKLPIYGKKGRVVDYLSTSLVVLRHPKPSKWVILGAAKTLIDERRMRGYYETFLPSVTDQAAVPSMPLKWKRFPRRLQAPDFVPEPTTSDDPAFPIAGDWSWVSLIIGSVTYLAALLSVLPAGLPAPGLVIAASGLSNIILGKAMFLYLDTLDSGYDNQLHLTFMEGKRARAFGLKTILFGLLWFVGFELFFPMSEWWAPQLDFFDWGRYDHLG